jgi:hypothetical protein
MQAMPNLRRLKRSWREFPSSPSYFSPDYYTDPCSLDEPYDVPMGFAPPMGRDKITKRKRGYC